MHSPRTTERAGAVDPRMRTRPSSITPSAALSGIWALLLIVFVVAALYFGRSVLVPIALATLITFLLSRLVTRLERWIGREIDVLVDETQKSLAIGRSAADAPEIDGVVRVKGAKTAKPGDRLRVHVTGADEYDLKGTAVAS